MFPASERCSFRNRYSPAQPKTADRHETPKSPIRRCGSCSVSNPHIVIANGGRVGMPPSTTLSPISTTTAPANILTVALIRFRIRAWYASLYLVSSSQLPIEPAASQIASSHGRIELDDAEGSAMDASEPSSCRQEETAWDALIARRRCLIRRQARPTRPVRRRPRRR